jgi:N-methylhydantoinase A/oxoprolinase/acetone carboxylase beta subunit
VFDAAQSRRLDYAVLPRETLSAGFGISGPCLVTESHTTTVVSSDFDLEVAADGALLLTSKPAMEGISQ